jgi:hypothetical protein
MREVISQEKMLKFFRKWPIIIILVNSDKITKKLSIYFSELNQPILKRISAKS